MVQLSHPYLTTGKITAFTIWTSVNKVMSFSCNMLSRFVIAFLPRTKHLLISWLQSLFIVTLEPKKTNSVTVSIFPSSICHEVMGPDSMILVFERWFLNQLLYSTHFPSSRGSLVLFCFLLLGWYHLPNWGCWYFSWQSWFQLVIPSAWHFTWCTLHRS